MAIIQVVDRKLGADDLAVGDGSYTYTDVNGVTQSTPEINASTIPFATNPAQNIDELVDGSKVVDVKPRNLDVGGTLDVTGIATLHNLAGVAGYVKSSAAGVLSSGTIATADLPLPLNATNVGTGVVTNAVFAYLQNVTSDIQAQINGIVGATGSLVQGSFIKLKVYNNAATPDTKLDVTATAAVVSTAAGALQKLSNVSRTMNSAVVGADGLSTDIGGGVLAINTAYYLYIIAKADATQGSLLSSSATAPTLPAGYTYYLLVNAILTDGAAHFLPIRQQNRLVYYTVPQAGFTSTSAAYVLKSTAAYIPAAAVSRMWGMVRAKFAGGHGASIAWALAWDNGGAEMYRMVGTDYYSILSALDGWAGGIPLDMLLNPAAPTALYVKGTDATDAAQFYCDGYEMDI